MAVQRAPAWICELSSGEVRQRGGIGAGARAHNAGLIFSAYRELVPPSDAAAFWEIRPAAEQLGKVVAMVA